MGKTRKQGDPYLVFENRFGWRFEVLKSWQGDDAKPFARWFCSVTSPMTGPYADMGDTYVADVLRDTTLSYADPAVFPDGFNPPYHAILPHDAALEKMGF
jgi:hypothetical protein